MWQMIHDYKRVIKWLVFRNIDGLGHEAGVKH